MQNSESGANIRTGEGPQRSWAAPPLTYVNRHHRTERPKQLTKFTNFSSTFLRNRCLRTGIEGNFVSLEVMNNIQYLFRV